MLFFFSSRRRHTRYWRDWSSDVCSSDLCGLRLVAVMVTWSVGHARDHASTARRSEERRVGKSVDLGGRGMNTEKKKTNKSKDVEVQEKIYVDKTQTCMVDQWR